MKLLSTATLAYSTCFFGILHYLSTEMHYEVCCTFSSQSLRLALGNKVIRRGLASTFLICSTSEQVKSFKELENPSLEVPTNPLADDSNLKLWPCNSSLSALRLWHRFIALAETSQDRHFAKPLLLDHWIQCMTSVKSPGKAPAPNTIPDLPC